MVLYVICVYEELKLEIWDSYAYSWIIGHNQLGPIHTTRQILALLGLGESTSRASELLSISGYIYSYVWVYYH